jgi:hypothetical protein
MTARVLSFAACPLPTTTRSAIFPNSWALSWCRGSRDKRLQEAAVFGIGESDLAAVTAWADDAFGTGFGAWSVFFDLAAARNAVRAPNPTSMTEIDRPPGCTVAFSGGWRRLAGRV